MLELSLSASKSASKSGLGSPIRLRAAVPDEAQDLTELALRSKAIWGYDQAFMEACREEMTVTPANITNAKGRIMVAEQSGQLLGYSALARVCDEGCELEALFIDPGALRQGIGSLLLAHCVNAARQAGASIITIQADPQAAPFYLAAGARQVGERESGSVPGRMLPMFEMLIPSSD